MSKSKEIIEKIGALAAELHTADPKAAIVLAISGGENETAAGCVVCGSGVGLSIALSVAIHQVPAMREVCKQAINACDYAEAKERELNEKQN